MMCARRTGRERDPDHGGQELGTTVTARFANLPSKDGWQAGGAVRLAEHFRSDDLGCSTKQCIPHRNLTEASGLKHSAHKIDLLVHTVDHFVQSRDPTINFSTRRRNRPPSIRRLGRPWYFFASMTNTPEGQTTRWSMLAFVRGMRRSCST
jgi:hypothetical protein